MDYNTSQSQLRQDMISGDWVLIAPGRSKRPGHTTKKKRGGLMAYITKTNCPFEKIVQEPLVRRGEGKHWRLVVIGNLYPALAHGAHCPVTLGHGPYHYLSGIGTHDLVITKGHKDHFTTLPEDRAVEVFSAVVERIEQLKKEPCIEYVSFFQNYGVRAGASQPHPHFQVIGLPVVPPEVAHSLSSSHRYYEEHHQCAHCAVLHYEIKQRERVVYENEYAVVIAPFASTHSYELRVFPRQHRSRIEETPSREIAGVVSALQHALRALKKQLGDPDYNFFVHTAPVRQEAHYSEYHWHIEIMPRLETFAGLELGTGIVINPTPPEAAAELLRKGV